MKTNTIIAMLCVLILSACGGGGSTADGKPCGNCDSTQNNSAVSPTQLPNGAPPNASPSLTILSSPLECVVIPPMSQVCTGAKK